MVREATIEDVPRLVELGEAFVAATILGQMVGSDPDTLAGILAALIDQPETCAVYVLEQSGEIVGLIAGSIVPLYFNSYKKAAQQYAWYVSPPHRSRRSLGLIGAFETWAKKQGADIVFSGAKNDDGFDGMDRLMTRRGYAMLEAVYIKEVH